MLRRAAQLGTHISRGKSTIGGISSSYAIRMIRTAGCLIIGDEILSSKTVDTNSAWFGKKYHF